MNVFIAIGFESFREQCTSCCLSLIKSGANPNSTDRLGRTVLHLAAFYNMTNFAEKLIQLHVNIMTVDYNSKLALHIAIERDNAEVLSILVK